MIAVFTFALPSRNVNAATKTYTISEDTDAPANYKKLSTYNSNTKDYYIFKNIFKQCADNKGGKVIIKKGEYTITNPICIASNITVVLEDGVVIKKGSSTGTSKLKPGKAIFDLVNPNYLTVADHYSGYSGEHDITIIGEGNAIMDVDFYNRGLAIIIGHSKNITIKNIHFMNMNSGHFIEMDACDTALVDGCTFENAKERGKYDFKEAINIDTPDLATHGFNSVWSSHDKTPDKNVHITNCIFKNLESGIGTHSASKKFNEETGLYDITQWHTNITVDYCKFINISRTCLRMYAWKDSVIENNEFTNDTSMGFVFEGWCVNNPTFKNNSINNFRDIGWILAKNHYSKKDGKIVKVPGQDYEPNYSYIYEQNIKDFYNNSVDMGNAELTIDKGITTAFPEKDLIIYGSDMKKN